ncbi:MAG: hypothetical protein C0395_03555 [Gemmatimonas sp.]|nr:hypothetical protein [Gemmatimonas sp.]
MRRPRARRPGRWRRPRPGRGPAYPRGPARPRGRRARRRSGGGRPASTGWSRRFRGFAVAADLGLDGPARPESVTGAWSDQPSLRSASGSCV